MDNSACRLCESASGGFHFAVNSKLGAQISLCSRCGFVQSNPSSGRAFSAPGPEIHGDRLSCDADYAPFRVGKAQMLSHQNGALGFCKDRLGKISSIFDAAGARGDFLRHALANFQPDSLYVREFSPTMLSALQVEASLDSRVVVLDGASGLGEGLPDRQFDLVYSTHSLEHFRRPRAEFTSLAALVAEHGLLLVDVPDVEQLDIEQAVEEYFYDEHLSYFSLATLQLLASQSGFVLVYSERTAGSIVSVFARHTQEFRSEEPPLPQLPGITRYGAALKRNRAALPSRGTTLVQTIRREANTQVVAVGCGRKFDAFLTYGGLDISLFTSFADNFLSRAVPTVRGRKLEALDSLRLSSPEGVVFVIFANGAEQEISTFLRTRFPRATIVIP